MKKLYTLFLAFTFGATLSMTAQQVHWSENFTGFPTTSNGAWTLIDANNDNRNWYAQTGLGSGQGTAARSDSWNSVPITPDNYMISPEITVPADLDEFFLTWKAWAHSTQWPAENYTVIIASGATLAAINEGTIVFNQVLNASHTLASPSTPNIDISDAIEDMTSFRVVFRHHDCFDMWSIYVDDVVFSSPINFGVSATALSSPSIFGLNIDDYFYSFTLNNIGATPITEFTYVVSTENVEETVEVTLDAPLTLGQSVVVNGSFEADFTVGSKTLNIEITEANDVVLENSIELSRAFNVLTEAYAKKPLVENFSSSTCPPCSGANTFLFGPTYAQLGVNAPESDVNVVKFQVPIPSAGDPSVNPHSLARRTFYNINAAPSVIVDGTQFDPFSVGSGTWASVIPFFTAAIEARQTQDFSPYQITGTYNLAGGTMTVDVNVVSGLSQIPAGHRLYISVNNDEYSFAGTNGETTFKDVNRFMMPDANGTVLSSSAFSQTFTRNNVVIGSVAAGNHNLWNEDINVIAWVQNATTREVITSQSLSFSATTNISEITAINKLKMFPNPTKNGETFISFNVVNQEQVAIEIYSITGQKVGSYNLGNVMGEVNQVINIANKPSGLYLVRIIAGAEATTLRLMNN
ncbi:MAG: T9SS type A sorting domain-containing protein [Luteibaculaceae bacterium]